MPKKIFLNIDDCITKDLNLETTAFENILSQPTASRSLSTCSESSKTAEEVENKEEDKNDDAGLDVEQPSSSKYATKTSFPLDSTDKAD